MNPQITRFRNHKLKIIRFKRGWYFCHDSWRLPLRIGHNHLIGEPLKIWSTVPLTFIFTTLVNPFNRDILFFILNISMFVRCRICQNVLKANYITIMKHLKCVHNVSFKDYKKKFNIFIGKVKIVQKDQPPPILKKSNLP